MVVERDDLHPLLSVQIIVQLLGAQLQPRSFIVLKVGRQTKFFGLRRAQGLSEQRDLTRGRRQAGSLQAEVLQRHRRRHGGGFQRAVLGEELLPVLDVGRVHFEGKQSRSARPASACPTVTAAQMMDDDDDDGLSCALQKRVAGQLN